MRGALSLLVLLFILMTCSVAQEQPSKKSREVPILGEYQYIRDSTSSPNLRFFESIELKKDSSFVYKNRTGGFIKTTLEGRWELKNELLILYSYDSQKALFSKPDCSIDSINGYLIDVKDFDEYSFNYSIKVGEQWIRELYGESILKKNERFDSIQIVSSSGIYSEKIKLDSAYNCYKIRMINKRQFTGESWIWLGSKIRPRRLDGELANYYLFKIKN